MKINKKNGFLIIIVIIFLIFAYMLLFHKWALKVSIQGIENGFVDIDIGYANSLYTCKLSNRKKAYINGDELEISCTNNLFSSINKQINYKIKGLYTNKDDLDVLFKQYENRKITDTIVIEKKDIIAVLKKKEDDHTSNYYCIVQELVDFTGYFDRGIVYDEVNKQYVQFSNKKFTKDIIDPVIVYIHDYNLQPTIDSYLKELDYTCIYIRDDFKDMFVTIK